MAKRTAATLFLLFLTLTICCFAADGDNQTTGGRWNGRLWTFMEHSERLGFALGYCDASSACPSQTTNGELVKGIDRFYQEPENLRLPIATALRVFTMKVAGAKASEIEEVMRVAFLFAEASESKK